MLTCPSDETYQFRSTQLDTVREKLDKLDTPTELTSSIIHGIEHWASAIYDSSQQVHPPSRGSVIPVDMLLMQAYSDQTNSISWDNFLQEE
jgi:hypothetical protein